MRSGGGNVEPLTKQDEIWGGAQADVLMWSHLRALGLRPALAARPSSCRCAEAPHAFKKVRNVRYQG
jgi:hypothetical protein